MKGMPGGLQAFIKQANQMQQRAQKLQEELAKKNFESSSGGGAVTAVVNGSYLIQSLSVKEDVVKSGDVEMLQDLILTAVNEAINSARKETEAEMAKLTGGVSMPGLF